MINLTLSSKLETTVTSLSKNLNNGFVILVADLFKVDNF